MWAALLAAYQAYSSTEQKNGGAMPPGQSTGGVSKGLAEIDFSGFTVATGGSKSNGANIKKGALDSGDALGALGDAMPGSLVSPLGLVVLGGLAIVAIWAATRKKKK